MTLVCKPRGRGNWKAVTVVLEGQRASPLLVNVGHLFTLGGVVFRVCKVLP